jgi:hypothetical protein
MNFTIFNSLFSVLVLSLVQYDKEKCFFTLIYSEFRKNIQK